MEEASPPSLLKSIQPGLTAWFTPIAINHQGYAGSRRRVLAVFPARRPSKEKGGSYPREGQIASAEPSLWRISKLAPVKTQYQAVPSPLHSLARLL